MKKGKIFLEKEKKFLENKYRALKKGKFGMEKEYFSLLGKPAEKCP